MHEIVYFQLRYLSLLPLQPIKYALDHEGWAVGVVALWEYYPKVLTLKTAIYLLSVIQTLLQIIADERNPFGGLPRRFASSQ